MEGTQTGPAVEKLKEDKIENVRQVRAMEMTCWFCHFPLNRTTSLRDAVRKEKRQEEKWGCAHCGAQYELQCEVVLMPTVPLEQIINIRNQNS